jgi:hypothetical protein
MRMLSCLQGKILRITCLCRKRLHDQWQNENNNGKRLDLHCWSLASHFGEMKATPPFTPGLLTRAMAETAAVRRDRDALLRTQGLSLINKFAFGELILKGKSWNKER